MTWWSNVPLRQSRGATSHPGKVTAQERGKATPTGSNPQEMAEKRAIARAARLAFGQSAYLDEDEAEQERNDPQRQAQLAQRYDEIFAEPEEESEAELLEQAEAARNITARAHDAAAMRQAEMAEIDRQRREEGLK